MCFSPIASFAASALLASVGGATIDNVLKKKSKSFLLLAIIPILFAIQQFIEGISWTCLKFNDTNSCSMPYTNGYLIFVGIIWPILFPITCYLLEVQNKRRKLLMLLSILGIILASANLYFILTETITAKIMNHSIFYTDWYPQILAYGPIIILPFILSSVPRLWIIGGLFTLSLIVSTYFFEITQCSVWCFFSAVLSTTIYFVIDQQPNQPRQKSFH